MKFQVSHIAKLALVAAISLSAFNMVGAQSNNEPEPTVPTPPPVIPTPTIPLPTIPTCGISLMECEPVVVATPAPAKPAVVNYEENVSFNDSDLGVALFKSVDADGNQQIVTVPGGGRTTYAWDFENRLTGVKLASGTRNTFGYDGDYPAWIQKVTPPDLE